MLAISSRQVSQFVQRRASRAKVIETLSSVVDRGRPHTAKSSLGDISEPEPLLGDASELSLRSSPESSPTKPPESSLRNSPYSYSTRTPHRLDPTMSHIHNMRLAQYAKSGDITAALMTCRTMKDKGIQPSLPTYHGLLEVCANLALPDEAWAIIDDMIAMNIQPDITAVLHLLSAHQRSHTADAIRVFNKMLEWEITPNATIYARVIECLADAGRFELVLQLYNDMLSQNIIPDLDTAQRLIYLSTQRGLPRLALDIVMQYEQSSVRRMYTSIWMHILISSAEVLYVDGVRKCWSTLVHGFGIVPDEGTCTHILHTAARHGLPDMATDVLQELVAMKIIRQEHHFAPIIEAFCNAGQLKGAFALLHVMRQNNCPPSPSTTLPLLEKMGQDVHAIDSSFALVEEMRVAGEPIDIVALEIIIQAATSSGDLQRAVGVYSSYPDFNFKPTTNTLNLILSGCVATKQHSLGDKLLHDMTHNGQVVPDSQTYEQVILLCLTQETYEDAFFYLEEMKSKGFKPPITVYEHIVAKCVRAGDQRYTIALDEMKECGYAVSQGLSDFITSCQHAVSGADQ